MIARPGRVGGAPICRAYWTSPPAYVQRVTPKRWSRLAPGGGVVAGGAGLAQAARHAKAAHILATRTVEPAGEDGRSWWVASERDPGQHYLVLTAGRGVWPCTCWDWERRHDWCKHGLAVALLRRCTERAAPPVDVDAPIPFALTAKGVATTREPEPAA